MAGKEQGKDWDLSKYFLQIALGMHVCSIYRNKEEQLSVIIPYLIFGLKHNERCVYVIGENTKEDICRLLNESGIRSNSYIQSGQLVFLNKEDTYLREGFFAPQRMLDLVENAHYEALRDGHYGLRGTGEMSWVLEELPGSDKLIDYESKINQIFPRKKMAVICQYDETKFPENVLLEVLHTHPKVIIYGTVYENPHYISADEFADHLEYKYPPGTYQKLRDNIINSQALN